MFRLLFLFFLIPNIALANCFELEVQIKKDINFVIGQAFLKDPNNYFFHNSIRNAIDNRTYVGLNRIHEKARLGLDCQEDFNEVQTILKNIYKTIN